MKLNKIAQNQFLDLATSYKEDGNFNFKHKNYRLAILSYTEGIKTKCNNPEIEATLYNNRAAANYFLKNYRFVFYLNLVTLIYFMLLIVDLV